MKTALLLIDLQNDFAPAARWRSRRATPSSRLPIRRSLPVWRVASRSWPARLAPANHRSFAVNSHAQVGTLGELEGLPQVVAGALRAREPRCRFSPRLQRQHINAVFRKGQETDIDSYSAFFDNGHRAQTELHGWLQSQGVQRLAIMGLATDYCVKFSVLDALAAGYPTQVIVDGCRGVNLQPDDSERALQDMARAGAQLVTLSQFLAS